MAHRRNTERDNQIYKMRLQGISCRELAGEYGISIERIRQVFKAVKYETEKNENTGK